MAGETARECFDEEDGGFPVRDFWYYHKVQIVMGIGILLLGLYYLAEILGKREPDYELALVCGQTVSDEIRASLEEGLAQYLSDVNGDGKVVVRVNSYYYGAESGFEAVSYTHLDVYKRQRCGLSHRRRIWLAPMSSATSSDVWCSPGNQRRRRRREAGDW